MDAHLNEKEGRKEEYGEEEKREERTGRRRCPLDFEPLRSLSQLSNF
jgi:hypothetical protein